MAKPTLVIMAAGLGSRYGGFKQMEPVDDHGNFIIDYSLYDAIRAGFQKVVCIVKDDILDSFQHTIGARVSPHVHIQYVQQTLATGVPPDMQIPPNREKPWGTAHAMLCAAPLIDGSFCIINADDFYGRTSFAAIYRFLTDDENPALQGMVGYAIENTVTENGHVARGVCETENGVLIGINERTRIEIRPEGIAYTEDAIHYTPIADGTVVSMNFWGFKHGMLAAAEEGFASFLKTQLPRNPLKGEYFIPDVVARMLRGRSMQFRVLPTAEKWYGITYRQDLPLLMAAIAAMRANGHYPNNLWR